MPYRAETEMLHNIAYIEFCIADIRNTHFSNEQFDVLTSNQTLEHLEQLDIALIFS